LPPVVVAGDPAPGTEPGTVFQTLFEGTATSMGRLFVAGYVSGPEVNASNDVGIWSGSTRESLRLLVREGDTLEVAPGDFRTIAMFGNPATAAFISQSGLEDGRQVGINERGEAAFHATFTDGSEGIFVVMPHVLPGDFNDDGAVDAADYVVWRRWLGTAYTSADYEVWRANFGRTMGGAMAHGADERLRIAVPEASTMALLVIGVLAVGCFRGGMP
jgi:hypothetical protein